ncbi:hypothetical protein J2Z32_002295 [Paenibacillus turicensis]|uniref:MacB-like periplasmic core domain-containing protein n=1 Tax=Paenibacillus turicensis TaxID=160487 RepID=A0ABS4FSY8_9BACL|nr:hypothetical protein [Paenibacillus turicensis]MBP1905665.1 hypothetical protein [Paenibacillus turicensis]
MKRIYEFLVLYINQSEKKYIYHLLQFVVVLILLHVVLYHLFEIKHLKQTIEDTNAEQLFQGYYYIEDKDHISTEMEQLQRKLPKGVNIITPNKQFAYTNERNGGKQITINFMNLDEITQFKYQTTKGSYFSSKWDNDYIYQAIIPSELNSKYKLGQAYKIPVEKNLKPLKEITIKVIGVREYNYILDLAYSPNIQNRDHTILVFDHFQDTIPLFYVNSSNKITVTFQSEVDDSSMLSELLTPTGLFDIRSIEENINNSAKVSHHDFSINITSLIVLLLLIIVSLGSFYYLEFYNKKGQYYIYLSYGITRIFLVRALLCLNFIVCIGAFIIGEMVWAFLRYVGDFSFLFSHTFITFSLSLFIMTCLTLLNYYYFHKARQYF